MSDSWANIEVWELLTFQAEDKIIHHTTVTVQQLLLPCNAIVTVQKVLPDTCVKYHTSHQSCCVYTSRLSCLFRFRKADTLLTITQWGSIMLALLQQKEWSLWTICKKGQYDIVRTRAAIIKFFHSDLSTGYFHH